MCVMLVCKFSSPPSRHPSSLLSLSFHYAQLGHAMQVSDLQRGAELLSSEGGGRAGEGLQKVEGLYQKREGERIGMSKENLRKEHAVKRKEPN